MDGLVACRVCQGQVSTGAATCPHCGEGNPTPRAERKASSNSRATALLAVLVLLIVGYVAYAVYDNHQQKQEKCVARAFQGVGNIDDC